MLSAEDKSSIAASVKTIIAKKVKTMCVPKSDCSPIEDISDSLSNNQAEYLEKIVEYYANPADTRTVLEFCADNNTTDKTFYKFKKEYHDEIFRRAEVARKKHIPELRSLGYRALASRLKRSDNAAKLLFQLLGDLVERSEVKTEILTADQKRERIRQLLDSVPIPSPYPSKSLDVAPGSTIIEKPSSDRGTFVLEHPGTDDGVGQLGTTV